jgi:GTP-binding protein
MIDASFVVSAASAGDFPREMIAAVALAGRSNVGKSSLINALVRRRLARTSAAPGKTRLANIYRVARGSSAAIYLVDLPGYGYARGGSGSGPGAGPGSFDRLAQAVFARNPAALLLVDARHPGLERDLAAWRWLGSGGSAAAIVATKIDKLARGERIRAMRTVESVFHAPALPVSAATGEGMDELWKLIERLTSRNSSRRPASTHLPPPLPAAPAPPAPPPGAATAPRPPTRAPRKK